MKKLLLPALALFLFACNDPKTAGGGDSAIVKTDSAGMIDTTPKTPVAELLGEDTIEPADKSAILFRFDGRLTGINSKPLAVKEVRKRFLPVAPGCAQEAAYTLNRFFELDSMYKADPEPNFDLGQTVQVDVRLVDTLDVSPDFVTVAWTMYYHTYEACPYSAGTYYMVSTYAKDGKLIDTQLVGQSTGGGDPPVSSHTIENANLFRDGSFKSLQVDTVEDSDAEGPKRYEITKAAFTGSIAKNGKIARAKSWSTVSN